jgi:hypothetical protein
MFEPKALTLVFYEDGSAKLVNHSYTEQGFEVFFEKAVIDCLKNKTLSDYYFVMDEKRWEISEHPQPGQALGQAPVQAQVMNFLSGTLTKEGNKVTCANPKLS